MTLMFWRPRLALLLVMVLALSVLGACGGQVIWASDTEIQAARHVHGGAPELTLVTIVHHQTGRGDHTALFINGRERVIFDPAGSWQLDSIPQRGDVHYGMTVDAGASFYLSHVRETHYAVVQRIVVTPEVAEQAKALAVAAGAVAPARCASTTSAILRQLPGFGGLRSTFFPHVLMRDFALLPGVQSVELHHDDPDIQARTRRVQAPLSLPAL